MFKSNLLFTKVQAGARPVLQSLPETTDGKPAQPTSFLGRYWYYILPLVVVLLMSPGEEEAPARGRQQPARAVT